MLRCFSIAETEYAINILGAAGVGLLSNHEGYYLGNAIFTPFFQKLSADNNRSRTIFVHPNGPCMHAGDGSLIDANPSEYCFARLSEASVDALP